MFAKLKTWAAEVLQFVKYAMTSEGVKRWMSIAHEVDKNYANLKQFSDSLAKDFNDAKAEIKHLSTVRKGLESDAAILVQRQREDAAKIERLEAQVKSSDNLVKMLEESHVKANESFRIVAAERDKHDRRAAEFQTQAKQLSEVMRALRHVIDVVIDGKHPEQWFAMTLAETLKDMGNTSATSEKPLIGPVTRASVDDPPLDCPNCGAKVGVYMTNNQTGVSYCEHCKPDGGTMADRASLLRWEEFYRPAPKPEIASIGDVLREMNRERVESSAKVPVRIPTPEQMNGTMEP